jgi:hypothetical protein
MALWVGAASGYTPAPLSPCDSDVPRLFSLETVASEMLLLSCESSVYSHHTQQAVPAVPLVPPKLLDRMRVNRDTWDTTKRGIIARQRDKGG